MARVFKLTPGQLKNIIAEEKARLGSMEDVEKAAKKTKEVEADGFADTLESEVDHYKGLKESEIKLSKRLSAVKKKRQALAKKLNEAKRTRKKRS